MQKNTENVNSVAEYSHSGAETTEVFGSNCIRLSPGEWVVVGLIIALIAWLGPGLWQRFEQFEPGSDYRMPYELSSDYGLYQRYAEWAVQEYDYLVVGDSVMWGHYVPGDKTLSAQLNGLLGEDRFANLGVDGIDPVALEGLLRYYGRAIANKNVILHLNLLWMSSPKQDLQTDKERQFNHPELLPQFCPKIPCYKASYSERMSVVMKHHIGLLNLASHISIAYYQSMDMPAWTVENPYDCPIEAVTFAVPDSNYFEPGKAGKATGDNNLPWVKLETSLQWDSFKRSIELLKDSGSNVFVLVGPFNEHLLKPESLVIYRNIQTQIGAWFKENNIPYYAPPVLAAEVYTDASHPLAEGYAELARMLMQDSRFKAVMGMSSQ
ncbi:MAG: hypothetical protein ACYS8Z_02655 [Planctomycetota bacterium]|jgi:hypothetical protein